MAETGTGAASEAEDGEGAKTGAGGARNGAAGNGERAPVEIGGVEVAAGTREDVEIHVERLASGPWISLPCVVLHGRHEGPWASVSAAVHGDEINGVEVVRRLITRVRPEELTGTLIVVPVVNQLGFMSENRYLPDRRDLNRSFPGSMRGPLAGRLAHIFMRDVISRCELGIDLHSGSDSRANLPQIRADLDDPVTREAAHAFAAPVSVHSRTRDGSLREAATQHGMTMLLFEGGEDNRFDDYAIEAAELGILRVLAWMGMIEHAPGTSSPTVTSRHSRWVRAPRGGLVRREVELGDRVDKRQVLGHISDIWGRGNLAVRAPVAGIVIGEAHRPRVNQGDAIFHVAEPEPADNGDRSS